MVLSCRRPAPLWPDRTGGQRCRVFPPPLQALPQGVQLLLVRLDAAPRVRHRRDQRRRRPHWREAEQKRKFKNYKKKVTVRLVDGREWCAVRAEMESGLHPVRERFRLGGAVLRNDSLRSCYLEQMHQYTLATGSVSCISERRISLNFEYKFIGLILGTHQTTYTSGVGQIKSPFPLRRN